MSRFMYQDYRPAVAFPKDADPDGPPPLAWYEPRMANGMQIIQPHAHSYGGIRKVGDPYDPWDSRDEDGTGDLFEEPSYPDDLFQDPYGEFGKLAWLARRNSGLPLSSAVEKGDIEAVRALLDGSTSDSKMAHLSTSHPETGEAAVHIAAATCQADVLELLIKTGAQVDMLDRQGWSPIMYLAFHSAESVRTGRVSATALQGCVKVLLENGADPLLMSAANPRRDILDWHGNSLDWASLAWNHTFLQAVMPHLSGEAPLREEPVPASSDPRITWGLPQPRLGSRFVMDSVHPFWRGVGHPRKIIISSGQPPFENPSSSGDYSWDFTGSRLVKAVAFEGTTLPTHPTNDDIAYGNIAEWEKTLDALLDGGAEVKLLPELWYTGHFSVPARVALKLFDASKIDIAQEVPFHPSQNSNGGSLAARIVESELCSAFSEALTLVQGLKDRGVDIVNARLLPKPYADVPRLQAPLTHLAQAVARRTAQKYEEQARENGESAETRERESSETFKRVHGQPVPIFALAVATLDPDLIDYLIGLGVSSEPPKDFRWSDFLPSPKLETIWPTTNTFCRHLLPARPCGDDLFAAYLLRRSATCAKLDSLGLH
ncbi:unnamed protein product [Tilletia controversa]|uniref:Uncharacterized protein n=1 Tax=Tilletia controversa TaxID=13291 RepID=A0A8X7MYL4_9BASI|nr:hypothetical protein CF328_g914 [Tilletia controversa]KAE8253637.1 hypothetical protein A4X06_0g1303 [Tilletia controversa]CAD6956388.1 unnamed protein product [Tilletia controversa]CAD6986093.1 unnamed protein product [Tilletia controversa]